MNQTKKLSLLFLAIISALWMFNCSDSKDEPNPEPPEPPKPAEVIISVDKTTIKADGKDVVTFKVTINGVETTNTTNLSIVWKGESPVPLPGLIFSTDSASSYIFYATYDGEISNEVSVEAVDVPVLITVDKAAIKANGRDAAVFTVTVDDQDVTSEASITLKAEPDSVLDASTFSTRQAGAYTFYAEYNGKKSDEINVEVSPVVVVLLVDKSSINDDLSETVTFTVTADGEDVTSEATIIQKGEPEITLEETSFSSENADLYTFYAVYDETSSNEIDVTVNYVKRNFLRHYCIMQFTGTLCPNCPVMRNEIQKAVDYYPKGQVEVVVLHLDGKLCSSGLSGALGQTANALTPNFLPSALVELQYPVALYATITPRELRLAINQASKVSQSGIAIESQVNGADIDFTVKVKASETNQFRFFAFIVEDNITYTQTVWSEDWEEIRDSHFIHNEVATYQLPETVPLDPLSDGIDLGVIRAGKVVSKTFSIHTKDYNAKRTVNLSNCRIIGFTLREGWDGKYAIDNVINCPVNGSVPYIYAE